MSFKPNRLTGSTMKMRAIVHSVKRNDYTLRPNFPNAWEDPLGYSFQMSSSMPPLQSLRAFEAAARLGGFAAAASELNITASALSHRVRLLERHLGAPLFERRARSIRLTEWGKAYLPSVVRALEEILGSTAAIFGPRGEKTLTVRAPLSYMAMWLAPAAERFMDLHPRILLRLVSSTWSGANVAEETDIDLRLGYGNWSDVDAHLLFHDIAQPVGNPETLRTGPAIHETKDLLSYPLIHTMGIEDHWGKLLAKHGVPVADTLAGVRVDSSIAAAELAAVSKRLALVQTRFLEPYVASGRLEPAIATTLTSEKGLYLVLHPGRRQKPEVILFRDWLMDTLSD